MNKHNFNLTKLFSNYLAVDVCAVCHVDLIRTKKFALIIVGTQSSLNELRKSLAKKKKKKKELGKST